MMKKILLLLLLAGPLMAVQGWAADDGKMLLVYYRDASELQRLDAFPESMLTDWKDVQGQWRVSTVADTAFCYNDARVDSVVVRTKAEVGNRLASIVQLKFNNKYNDQVYTDVVADITGDSLITARVAGIGKWLTPSVQFSDDSARLYVGRELQLNKQSRRKFDKDVIYTVALPRQRCYEQVLVKEAVWDGETEQYVETPVELDASMFSGNLPGRDGEGWAQMLDGDVNTFYHSTWDVPQEEKETIYNTEPYIEIALPEELSRLRFGYTTRNNDGYAPLKLTLYASKDGKSWKNIRSFTADEDGLPTGAGQTYESQQVDLGSSYKYLRLRLMESQRHRYLVFSEFRLWRVTENPDYHGSEQVEPAEYAYEMVPFGRNYRVHVDWPTDKATQVPRIDINIENGEMVSSKDYYLNADITIDGAGVFPSMGHTAVQIKGRGNSSWNGWWPYDKNPYRLKFSEKIKPFGLTKGKNWVLLANKQTGSMTSNAIGMKAACLVGTAGANHMVPVELYINGEYRGSYNFTEKVGLANNSIDLADESAATLLELDTYYDEAYKFRSQAYNLPVNIKEPEFDEAGSTTLTQSMIEQDFNTFMSALKQGKDVADLVDIEMLARFLMVNDLIANYEPQHPKSTFLYKEFVGNSDSKFVFGPVWDLDWAFGYERGKNYFQNDVSANYWTTITAMESRQFIYDLRFVSKALDKAYYQLWTRFRGQPLDELIDFCDDYYAYARPSLENNATLWGDGKNYGQSTAQAKVWLRRRADYIYSRLTAYELDPEEEPADDISYQGDTDGIEVLSNHKQAESSLVDVYDLSGRLVKQRVSVFDLRTGLQPGIYIVGGRKMMVK